jgi:hypothetical protein
MAVMAVMLLPTLQAVTRAAVVQVVAVLEEMVGSSFTLPILTLIMDRYLLPQD